MDIDTAILIYQAQQASRPTQNVKRCVYNSSLVCRWRPCPLGVARFTGRLDRYCERYASPGSVDCSQIHGDNRDPIRKTHPDFRRIEVPLWFDHYEALEAYSQARESAKPLQVTRDMCRALRIALARWYAREMPMGMRRPSWYRERPESAWRRVAVPQIGG